MVPTLLDFVHGILFVDLLSNLPTSFGLSCIFWGSNTLIVINYKIINYHTIHKYLCVSEIHIFKEIYVLYELCMSCMYVYDVNLYFLSLSIFVCVHRLKSLFSTPKKKKAI